MITRSKHQYFPPQCDILEALAMSDMLQVASGSQLEDVEGDDLVDGDDGWDIL